MNYYEFIYGITEAEENQYDEASEYYGECIKFEPMTIHHCIFEDGKTYDITELEMYEKWYADDYEETPYWLAVETKNKMNAFEEAHPLTVKARRGIYEALWNEKDIDWSKAKVEID
ncbi:hypothetical protein ACOIFF_03430 [Klebsiella pneumoniae]|uniref:hypothetical protein n=1 Tax=Klebsiella pneumoniae TaxID=573 RepID=UPI000807B604|nr:hypothetical protein [Klebsiella pneumoniae]MBZ1999405.1 hypothetical protein [Klebsiella pneumoniae]MCQ0735021.1 hypothetical protein [Klebsiella pneumoniae]MDD1879016.1 hypothetical protein [Klebsiella pneumoniae]MEB5562837.1 hypothetical protein [Klebsiella pneumoniae]MEC4502301.1 hypothetical protein [Klebsiella pneumoniae]